MYNAKQLAGMYSDQDWRTRFLQLTALLGMLADCIIDTTYTIPDELNESLTLTAAGKKLVDHLHRKDQVPVKEARLMVALTLGHDDLFVDVAETDLEKMRTSISTQVLKGALRFPLVLGRELYDAYASLFEDERDDLNLEDTFRLLDRTPTGVYQYGHYVLGPYGILESRASRSIRASRNVPAFHCAQASCRLVHRAHLTTSQGAAVNMHRSKIHDLLDERKVKASEWWGLQGELNGVLGSFYSDNHAATLIALLGDCLTNEELEAVLQNVLDRTAGAVRKRLPSGMTGSAESITSGLARNQMLQLLLLADEVDLARVLDRLVRTKVIRIDIGDVRSPVVNEARKVGAFGLRAELGARGVRFVSDDVGLPALRMRRLLKKLYLRDSASDTEELEWQLRGFDAEDLDERLEDFYQATTPREALQRMILVRKTNLIMASHEVDVEDIDTLTDEEIVESVLWKLGFQPHVEEDRHEYVWDLHQRLTALTRSSRISGSGESERFRGVASTFFTELEGVLADSLAFATWLLTVDHSTAAFPFEYDDEFDRINGLARLQYAHQGQSGGTESFDYTSDKIELYSLLRGFAVLANDLDRLQIEADEYLRGESDYPSFDGKTDLKEFIFRHTVPFLDLTEGSRARISSELREISRKLVAADVHQVRNDYSHYRRNARDITAMTSALEAVGNALRDIENLGFARIICRPTEVMSDPWGRSQYGFAGPRSVSHLFARPSNYDWMGLPSLRTPQYIVHAAAFAEPNEVLRVKRRYDSSFSALWSEYPKRRVAGTEAVSPALSAEEVGVNGPAADHS